MKKIRYLNKIKCAIVIASVIAIFLLFKANIIVQKAETSISLNNMVRKTLYRDDIVVVNDKLTGSMIASVPMGDGLFEDINIYSVTYSDNGASDDYLFLPSNCSWDKMVMRKSLWHYDEVSDKDFIIMKADGITSTFIKGAVGMETMLTDKNISSSAIMSAYNSDSCLDGNYDIAIKGHGNGSWDNNEKKSWTVFNESESSILGIPAGRKYVLISNAQDKSYLRNKFTFEWAKAIGLDNSPESVFTLVYYNGDCLGMYLLTEGVEAGMDRINVAAIDDEYLKYKANDLSTFEVENMKGYVYPNGTIRGTYTENAIGNNSAITDNRSDVNDIDADSIDYGDNSANGVNANGADISVANTISPQNGYIFKCEFGDDRYEMNTSAAIKADDGTPYHILYPEKPDIYQTKQLKSIIENIHTALLSSDGTVAVGGVTKHYSELVDIDSFIKKYLIEQISKNRDGNGASAYYYIPNKYGEQIVFAGPVWDYDGAYGGYIIDSFWQSPAGMVEYPYGYDKRPEFIALAKQYYVDTFLPYLDNQAGETIRSLADTIRNSETIDDVIWKGNPYWDTDFNTAVGDIINFIEERKIYLIEGWVEGIPFYRVNLVDGEDCVCTFYVKEGEDITPYIDQFSATYTGNFRLRLDHTGQKLVGWFEEDMETPSTETTTIDDNVAFWGVWE